MNLVTRAKNILLTPQAEWGVIERETGDTGFLFRNYVAILAAIPAVCSVIGLAMLTGATRGFLILGGVIHATIAYLLSFVGVWLLAVVIDLLAPIFGARKDFASAMKLSAYAHTPYWVAGVFFLVPALSVLTLLGLYAVYLVFLGLPILMKAPQGKAPVYTIAIIVCAVVFLFIVTLIAGATMFALLGAALLR